MFYIIRCATVKACGRTIRAVNGVFERCYFLSFKLGLNEQSCVSVCFCELLSSRFYLINSNKSNEIAITNSKVSNKQEAKENIFL